MSSHKDCGPAPARHPLTETDSSRELRGATKGRMNIVSGATRT